AILRQRSTIGCCAAPTTASSSAATGAAACAAWCSAASPSRRCATRPARSSWSTAARCRSSSMSWQSDHADRELSHREAIAKIPKGQHVFIASGAAEPVGLVHELVAQADRFADNVLVHLLTL